MVSEIIEVPMTEEVAKAHDSYSEKVLDESGVVVQELGSNSFPVVVPNQLISCRCPRSWEVGCHQS